jgi:putative ABC transport system ATP-binding protein
VSARRGPVIRLEGVALEYQGPPTTEALRQCSLVVASGDYVTVVGPSGSGKSTLLNVIGILDAPTSGRYFLDGVDVATIRERERAALRGSRIGFVFQAFNLLPHRTAIDNVALALVYQTGDRSTRRGRAREALTRVGLGHRLYSLPTRLSGGERQRVAIARALVTRPSIVLCDEPTGNLDSATANSILTLLDELHNDGVTIVVITHDRDVAARGERTLVMRDGVLADSAGAVIG